MKCLVHNLQLPQCCQLEVINGGWVFSQIEGSVPIVGLGKGIKNFVYFERHVDIFFPREVDGSGMVFLFRIQVCGRGMHLHGYTFSCFYILYCVVCGWTMVRVIGK